MAPKVIRSLFLLASILIPLAAFPIVRAYADDVTLPDTDLPGLGAFIASMNDGQVGELRAVYVPHVLADVVVQQPSSDATFVSTTPGVLTQFRPATSVGSTGLLAHNYLAGATFTEMDRGDVIYLVYGNGRIDTYRVTQTLKYRALSPESPYSNFIDLSSGTLMTASSVFSAAYDRPGDVVLQTCIDANGNPSWGRLFIVAEPYARPRDVRHRGPR